MANPLRRAGPRSAVELTEAAFEEAALRLLARQAQSAFVGLRGPRRSAPGGGTDRRGPNGRSGSRRDRRGRGSRRSSARPASGTVAHGDRHGPVELDHRRGVGAAGARRRGRRSPPSRWRRRRGRRRGRRRSPPGARRDRSGARRAPARPAPGPRRSAARFHSARSWSSSSTISPSGEARAARRDFVQQHQGQQAQALGLGQQLDQQAGRAGSPRRRDRGG